MLTFEPCRAGHFKYIAYRAVQTEEFQRLMDPAVMDQLLGGLAISAWASGVCLGAAGILQEHRYRAEAWLLLGDGCARYLKPILRHIRYVLDTTEIRRIDMSVRASNKQGHSLARALKFEYEATLQSYHMSGDDVMIYKRIRP